MKMEQVASDAQMQMAQQKEETLRKDKETWERGNTYKAEIQSLMNEIEGYKATIVKLEGNISENYNFKILAEQNEMLKGDIESYRNQVCSAGARVLDAWRRGNGALFWNPPIQRGPLDILS